MKRECCNQTMPNVPKIDTVIQVYDEPIMCCFGRRECKFGKSYEHFIDSLFKELGSEEELFVKIISDSNEIRTNSTIVEERFETIKNLFKAKDSTVSIVMNYSIMDKLFDSVECRKAVEIEIKPKQKVLEERNKLTIWHEYNSSNTIQSGELTRALDELLTRMKQKNLTIRITSHTDNDGTEREHFLLSRQRALAIKKYLVSNGANPIHILTEYKGAKDPIASNETEEGRAKNRRSEIEVIK
ncbi:MAG: OmpA family protein [Saprospiraceae bacterium]|nr:OmpA family protein [Saprospiraceae bacterium]